MRGTFLGVPMLRIIVFWGLYWGPLIWGKYHIYLGSLRPVAVSLLFVGDLEFAIIKKQLHVRKQFQDGPGHRIP